MTPIEAMARAMFDDTQDRMPPSIRDSMWPDFRKGYISLARAALTALRDNGVTEGMISAYYAVPVTLSDEYGGETCYAAAEFRAMLDAALGEG